MNVIFRTMHAGMTGKRRVFKVFIIDEAKKTGTAERTVRWGSKEMKKL